MVKNRLSCQDPSGEDDTDYPTCDNIYQIMDPQAHTRKTDTDTPNENNPSKEMNTQPKGND